MSFYMGISAIRRVGGVSEGERFWIACGDFRPTYPEVQTIDGEPCPLLKSACHLRLPAVNRQKFPLSRRSERDKWIATCVLSFFVGYPLGSLITNKLCSAIYMMIIDSNNFSLAKQVLHLCNYRYIFNVLIGVVVTTFVICIRLILLYLQSIPKTDE